jgi:hypothetical protein
MDATGHAGMSSPLSAAEVAYSLVQQASATPDLIPSTRVGSTLRAYLGSEFSCQHRFVRLGLAFRRSDNRSNDWSGQTLGRSSPSIILPPGVKLNRGRRVHYHHDGRSALSH